MPIFETQKRNKYPQPPIDPTGIDYGPMLIHASFAKSLDSPATESDAGKTREIHSKKSIPDPGQKPFFCAGDFK